MKHQMQVLLVVTAPAHSKIIGKAAEAVLGVFDANNNEAYLRFLNSVQEGLDNNTMSENVKALKTAFDFAFDNPTYRLQLRFV